MSWFRSIWQAIAREEQAAGDAVPSNGGVRHISQAGIDLVTHFEGFYPTTYICPAGVPTIGFGHTGLKHKDGTVFPGRKITRAEGEELLKHDMRHFEAQVKRLVTVPLEQHEFDALVSFAFNVGAGALEKSTLLRKLNAGDRAGAANEFSKWTKADGRVLKGLVRRRNAEATMFRGEDWRKFVS